MARRATGRPTEGELQILRVLWHRGPSTVRQINDVLNEHHRTGYTTTLKLMQIMLVKKILRRNESVRPQVYRPAASQGQTQRQLVGDRLDRVFDGSASRFVLQVLAAKRATPEELAEIRKLLSKHEGRSK